MGKDCISCFSDIERLQVSQLQHSLTVNQSCGSWLFVHNLLLLVVYEQRLPSDMEELLRKIQKAL